MALVRQIPQYAANVEYRGAWGSLATVAEVQLESASNISYSSGSFGNVSGSGRPLSNHLKTLSNNVEFKYDKLIDKSTAEDADGWGSVAGGIYDTAHSGVFASDTYLRIVEGGTNIKTGCAITQVYAKNFTTLNLVPRSNQAFVDPASGTFMLPLPYYWSKCETKSELTTDATLKMRWTLAPSVYEAGTGLASEGTRAMAYNNGYSRTCYTTGGYATVGTFDNDFFIYPLGSSDMDNSRGAIELWIQHMVHSGLTSGFTTAAAYVNSYVKFISNSSNLQVVWYCYEAMAVGGAITTTSALQLYVNGGAPVMTYTGLSATDFALHHIYIIWDTAGLTGGKKVRVFVDGTERLYSTLTPTGMTSTKKCIMLECDGRVGTGVLGTSEAYSIIAVDNIKLWRDAVAQSEVNPSSWCYNSGTKNREDALHLCYGATNSYKPRLTTALTGGVGYHYLLPSISAVNIDINGAGNVAATLEAAQEAYYGAGRFNLAGSLYKSTYAAIEEGSDFTYDTALTSIYDTGASGALGAGKYFRIVENGVNVITAAPAGMALTVMAKRLPRTVSPPADEVYVDPIRGTFVLPRPYYWSKCENVDNLTTPEIDESGSVELTDGGLEVDTGKFGNCLYINSNGEGTPWGSKTFELKPMGEETISEAGVISLWFKMDRLALIEYIQRLEFRISGTNYSVGIYNDYSVATSPYAYVKMAGVQELFTTISEPTSWSHLYIIWDKNAGLDDGKTIRVFLDGAEVAYSSTVLEIGIPIIVGTVSNGYTVEGDIKLFIDNIKMWNHVPTQDPDFEYDSGTGREDAIHYIYGATNGYVPDITSASSGAGYYQAAYAPYDVRITI